jgi:hypothetical protein
VNGELFETKDGEELKMKITEMFGEEYAFDRNMGAEKCDPGMYIDEVLGVYGGAA